MTNAEMVILDMRDLLEEERLSCQILREEDMKVRVSTTVSGTRGDHAREPLSMDREALLKGERTLAL